MILGVKRKQKYENRYQKKWEGLDAV